MRKAIRDRLRVPNAEPTPAHCLLAKLPFPCIITTNFDSLMERALEAERKNPQVESYVRRADKKDLRPGTEEEPLVYKLHGSIDQIDTLIATEDDVIDFAACLLQDNPSLPSLIGKLFETNTLLFVGYGLRDWNVRMMLRALRKRRGPSGTPDIASYAIQRRPAEPGAGTEWEKTVMYWDRVERLRCFDVDVYEFLEELLRRDGLRAGRGKQ